MQHLTKLSVVFDMPTEQSVPLTQISAIGPYLQGVLMEHLDAAYVGQLHNHSFNPYSQYCWVDKENQECIWRINTLTDEASNQIIRPIQEIDSILVRRSNLSLKVKTKIIETIELKCLTDRIRDDNQKKSSLTFLTPTSFKSSGSYVFMPSVRFILQNLLMHYDALYGDSGEIDEETLQYMEQNVKILSYRLHSQYFSHVSGTHKIPAFMGSLTLSCQGPQPIVGLVRMLLNFGEYAGIGIKTAMGMGGMKCV